MQRAAWVSGGAGRGGGAWGRFWGLGAGGWRWHHGASQGSSSPKTVAFRELPALLLPLPGLAEAYAGL